MLILPTMAGFSSARRGNQAIFVGWAQGTTGAVPLPANAAANDWAFTLVSHQSGGSAPVGWALHSIGWSSLGYITSIIAKKLTAGDVASPPTVPNQSSQGLQTVVYRGVHTYAYSGYTNETGGSDISLTRPAKNAKSLGQVSFVCDRDVAGTHVPPTGWTKRGQYAPQFFAASIADRINGTQPVGAGTDIWTGFNTTYPQVGFLIELRSE